MEELLSLGCGCPSRRYARRDAGGFCVRRCTYLPSCRLGAHEHPEDRLVLTLSGTFESVYGRRRYPLDASRALFRPAGVRHLDLYPVDAVCLSIALPVDVAPGLVEFKLTDGEFPSFVSRLSSEVDATDSAAPLAMEALCAMMIGRMRVVHHEERRPRWIHQVRERVEADYADPPTLAAIAASVNRDVSHVATTFRKAYGTTIGDYVRDVRIWRLRRLVEDASIPLADVAQLGGFADQSHFARLFRRRFRMTPGAYRQRTLGR